MTIPHTTKTPLPMANKEVMMLLPITSSRMDQEAAMAHAMPLVKEAEVTAMVKIMAAVTETAAVIMIVTVILADLILDEIIIKNSHQEMMKVT